MHPRCVSISPRAAVSQKEATLPERDGMQGRLPAIHMRFQLGLVLLISNRAGRYDRIYGDPPRMRIWETEREFTISLHTAAILRR